MHPSRYLTTLSLLAISLALAFDPHASAADGRCASYRTLGYDDGVKGLEAHLDERGDACTPTSSTDRDQYMTGWQSGMRQYCEPDHAFALGNAGEAYRNACRGQAASAFRDAYFAGRRVFLEASAIGDLEDTLAAHERDLTSLDAEINAARENAGTDASASNPREWSSKAQQLAATRRDIAAEIDDLELEIRTRKNDLAALDQSVADND
jgi:hypothetical protein